MFKCIYFIMLILTLIIYLFYIYLLFKEFLKISVFYKGNLGVVITSKVINNESRNAKYQKSATQHIVK